MNRNNFFSRIKLNKTKKKQQKKTVGAILELCVDYMIDKANQYNAVTQCLRNTVVIITVLTQN